MARRPNPRCSFLPFLGLLAVVASESTALGGPVLIGGTSDGILYDIDAATGALSNPRDTGLNDLTSLAFSPDGMLFAHTGVYATEPTTLYSVDSETGVPHGVAQTGLHVADFAYDSSADALIAVAVRAGRASGLLNHIDTQTGVATALTIVSRVGSLATNEAGQVFSLYLLDASMSDLVMLDVATGENLREWTLPISDDRLGLVSIDDDRLLISDTGDDGGTWLRAFDLDTGTFATVGPLGADIVALAYIPEPSTLVLFGCIIGLFAWRRRRLGATFLLEEVAMARPPNTHVSFLLFLGLVTIATPVPSASAGPVLIGGTSDGILYDIDAATGALSNPRDTWLGDLTSLAFSPDETLFAHTGLEATVPNTLFFVDVDSGSPHTIARTGLWLADFAYDPSVQALVAVAYRFGAGSGRLYHITTDDGVATPGGLAFSSVRSLASDRTGAIYSLYPIDGSRSELDLLDLATGANLQQWILPIADDSAGIVYAEDDRLLISDTGNDGNTWLRVFDLDSETLSTVGPLGADIVALAYIPEPSTLVLFFCIIGVFAWYRRGFGATLLMVGTIYFLVGAPPSMAQVAGKGTGAGTASAGIVETGMGGPQTIVYHDTLRGGFVVVGWATRECGCDGCDCPPLQMDPVSLSVTGIPATGTVAAAYANWSYLTNDTSELGTIEERTIPISDGSTAQEFVGDRTDGRIDLGDFNELPATLAGP